MRDRLLRAGIVAALLAVALGAFGAHGLRHRLSPADLATFETGVRYQMYHALALLSAGVLAGPRRHPWLDRAGWFFTLGILLFSGSLYLMVLSGVRWLGAVTPFGGVAFLAGWVALGIAVARGAGAVERDAR